VTVADRAALEARLSEVTWELASISRQGKGTRRKLAKVVRELEAQREELRARLEAC
jgi:hypothetical protein